MTSSSNTLFDTVPKKNFLSFNEDDYQKIIDSLGFKKKDVAIAAKVPEQSVRYDEKMPQELKDRIVEWVTLLQLVAQHFKDERKTLLWIKIPNHLLGGIAPRDMIRFGRYKKLLKFVVNALEESRVS